MKELRPDELAADVVAWHNRNPLARHIRLQHVHSLGYVMLPFVDADAAAPHSPAAKPMPEGGEPLQPEDSTSTLREKAMARAQQLNPDAAAQSDDAPPRAAAPARVKPVFDGDFLAPHGRKTLKRWTTQYAVAQNTPRGGMPVRRIDAESGWSQADVLQRWVLTAQVEVGNSKTRVLLGPGAPPAVLGRRLISPARILVVLALAGALLGIAGWLLGPASGRTASAAKPAMAAASAASSAAAPPAAAATPASAGTAQAEGGTTVTAAASAVAAEFGNDKSQPSPNLAASARASIPADVEPRLGQIDLPYIGPRAQEQRRKAQESAASAAALTAAPTAPATPAPTPTPEKPAPEPAPRQAAVPPASASPVFAVATRALRTRSESDQVATAMRELLSNAAGTAVRVEVLPAGDDWRVVGWPYTDRSLADKARALLISRGMRVEVIDF